MKYTIYIYPRIWIKKTSWIYSLYIWFHLMCQFLTFWASGSVCSEETEICVVYPYLCNSVCVALAPARAPAKHSQERERSYRNVWKRFIHPAIVRLSFLCPTRFFLMNALQFVLKSFLCNQNYFQKIFRHKRTLF